MSVLHVDYHDTLGDAPEPITVRYVTHIQNQAIEEPYFEISLGYCLTLYFTRTRLGEMRDIIARVIDAAEQSNAAALAGAIADDELEQQERMHESGAVRCPPRE